MSVAPALLVGCSSPTSPGVGADPTEPAQFTARDTLTACTSVQLGQGAQLPASALACIAQPGSELKVTAPTTEGDPVTTWYRSLPGEGYEIFTDMTQDPNGGGWWLDACPSATSIHNLGECVNTRLDASAP